MGFDRLRFKIEELRRYIEVLELYRYADLENLQNDPDLRNSAENSMQVAADCTLDIAGMVLIEQGIEEQEDYMLRISALGDIEILEEEFSQKLALTADYWDVLLRHRTKVDVTETHHHIQYIADDLRHFIEVIGEYAESDLEDREIEYEDESEEECADAQMEPVEVESSDCEQAETIGEEIIEEAPIEEECGPDEMDNSECVDDLREEEEIIEQE